MVGPLQRPCCSNEGTFRRHAPRQLHQRFGVYISHLRGPFWSFCDTVTKTKQVFAKSLIAYTMGAQELSIQQLLML